MQCMQHLQAAMITMFIKVLICFLTTSTNLHSSQFQISEVCRVPAELDHWILRKKRMVNILKHPKEAIVP